MVVLFLSNLLQLKDSATHLKTKFELSDTMNFSNIIASSISDKNLHAVLFDVELDPTKKYYGRAQALLTTGWTRHANLDVVSVTLSGLTSYKNNIIPSKISIPLLRTDKDQSFHDVTNFKIEATGFNRVGTASHNRTIYFISDTDNNIIWYRVSETSLNSVTVDDIILQENKQYKINALFGSSSNDFSQVATMSICTGGNKTLHMLSDSTIRLYENLDLNFMVTEGITNIEVEVYSITDSIVNKIYTQNFNSFNITIPTTVLNKTGLYLLKAKSNLDTVPKIEVIQVTV